MGLMQPISTALRKGLRVCPAHWVIGAPWGGQSIVVCVTEQYSWRKVASFGGEGKDIEVFRAARSPIEEQC